MRPWKRWWTMPVLMFVGILLPGLAAPSAVADAVSDYAAVESVTICGILDSRPSLDVVTAVGVAVMSDGGFTADQAGRVIVGAVVSTCPRHVPLLQRYARVYGTQARQLA